MASNDYKFFIFEYKLKLKFYNRFFSIILINLKLDLKIIKKYYFNIFSWNKWKNEKILLFLIIFFYSCLFITGSLNLFFYYKFIFYLFKYIIKYLFLIIDFIFFSIYYLFPKKFIIFRLLCWIYKINYKLLIKIPYRLYRIIFYNIPYFIHYWYWINLFNLIKFAYFYRCHKILDFIEWIAPIIYYNVYYGSIDSYYYSKKFIIWLYKFLNYKIRLYYVLFFALRPFPKRYLRAILHFIIFYLIYDRIIFYFNNKKYYKIYYKIFFIIKKYYTIKSYKYFKLIKYLIILLPKQLKAIIHNYKIMYINYYLILYYNLYSKIIIDISTFFILIKVWFYYYLLKLIKFILFIIIKFLLIIILYDFIYEQYYILYNMIL